MTKQETRALLPAPSHTIHGPKERSLQLSFNVFISQVGRPSSLNFVTLF